MPITQPGDFPIDPITTSGPELADRVNRLAAADESQHAHTSRPPNITDGMIWARLNENGTKTLIWFHNGADYGLFWIGTEQPYSGLFYSKAEVDNKIAALQQEVDAQPVWQSKMIGYYWGTIEQLPTGWLHCNGTNGTPDMRNRVVVGAGSSYNLGATGGQDSITRVPSHSHSVNINTNLQGSHNHSGTTNTAGNHRHEFYEPLLKGKGKPSTGTPVFDNGGWGESAPRTNYAGNHNHSFTTDTQSAHAHNVSGNTASSGYSSVDVRNKYIALWPIMKT